MSLRRSFVLFAPLLSIAAVACGGAIDSPRSETVDPATPGTGPSRNGGGSGVGTCTAAPSCNLGDTRVKGESACPQDDASCYSRSLCGQTIWCASTAQCAGYPSCNPDSVQVKSCSGSPDCTKVTVCGVTIFCEPDSSQCDGLPNCDPGDTQVASPSQCLQDDALCYQRTTCGVSIWCTGPSKPDAGPPPPPQPGNP
jgi:hypothetical protein